MPVERLKGEGPDLVSCSRCKLAWQAFTRLGSEHFKNCLWRNFDEEASNFARVHCAVEGRFGKVHRWSSQAGYTL